MCEAERSGRNDRSREGERARQWMFEGKVVAMTKTMMMMMVRMRYRRMVVVVDSQWMFEVTIDPVMMS